MRVHYSILEKYNIRIDDGITYTKRFHLVTTESDGLVDYLYMDDLNPNTDFDIKDGDTIVISPFARSTKDPDLYGFFVSVKHDDGDDYKSGTMGIFIPLEDYPVDSYEMFVYAGKWIASALKNEEYKNISVELDFIMNYGECVRYLEYCKALGDEKEAITYTCEKNLLKSIFCNHKLKKYDVLIRFRPQDLEIIAFNINEISDKLNIGASYERAGSYIKGFVYLNKSIECYPINFDEIELKNRYTVTCPSNGLYLCLDSSILDKDDFYLDELMTGIDSCSKKFGIELLACTGDLKWTEDDTEIEKCGSFIKNKDVFDTILTEIAINEEKYKANYSMNSNSLLEEVFKSKGIETLVFSDILIKSSREGMIEIYEKLDDIRKCLDGSNLFVKGFAYAKKYEETTSDCSIRLDTEFNCNHEYDIEAKTLYLVLGDKENYMNSYDATEKIVDLLDSEIVFTVVAHQGADTKMFEDIDLAEYIENPKSVIEGFKTFTDIDKYITNYTIGWSNDMDEFIECLWNVSAKRIFKTKYLLGTIQNYKTPTVKFREIDMAKITDDHLELFEKFVCDIMGEEYAEFYSGDYRDDSTVEIVNARIISAIWFYIDTPKDSDFESQDDLELINKVQDILEKAFTTDSSVVKITDEMSKEISTLACGFEDKNPFIFAKAESLLKN